MRYTVVLVKLTLTPSAWKTARTVTGSVAEINEPNVSDARSPRGSDVGKWGGVCEKRSECVEQNRTVETRTRNPRNPRRTERTPLTEPDAKWGGV